MCACVFNFLGRLYLMQALFSSKYHKQTLAILIVNTAHGCKTHSIPPFMAYPSDTELYSLEIVLLVY